MLEQVYNKQKTIITALLLICIVLLAAFLRLYKINEIPASLNQDELSLGYNAFSLLETGTDEHGVFFPLSLQSFGDWKLPVYPLISILPIIFLGLTETAIRIPSALAGIVDVFLIFLIAFELFKRRSVAIIAACFFALSPWSIYFSRIAYEVNLATTFFLFGFLLLIRYIHKKGNSKQLIAAAILFGLTLFTYHSFILFTPFFLLLFFIIHQNCFKKEKFFYIAILFFGIFAAISFWTTFAGSINKASNINVFNDPFLVYSRMKLRGDNAPENPLIKQILYNKFSAGFYQMGQNYLSTFSPAFLFDKGGVKLTNSLGYFGNLYLFDSILLVAGITSILWKKEREIKLLLAWIITSPIPSAITQDAPSATRLFVMLPVFILIGSYGAYTTLDYLRKKSKIYSGIRILLVAVFILNVIYFMEGYYIHLNIQRGEFLHAGYKKIVEITNQYPNYSVVMRGPNNFPYISFLFYNRYDPRKFQKEVIYYPKTDEGFLLVKSFGRFSFVDSIDYNNLKSKTLYIDLEASQNRPAKTVYLPSGKPFFWYFLKN